MTEGRGTGIPTIQDEDICITRFAICGGFCAAEMPLLLKRCKCSQLRIQSNWTVVSTKLRQRSEQL